MERRRWWRVGWAALLAGLAFVASACGGGGPSSSGGPRPAPVPAIEQRVVDVNGTERAYRLFTPPSPRKPAALVLALHGGGNTAESLVETSQLDRAAAANGFLVAYPEAPFRAVWNGGFCCTGGRGNAAEDLQFLDQVITDVVAARQVDSSRVYAVGVSAGAVMAYRLGCDRADRIAGVGSVAGVMLLDDCRPSRPVPVIEVHGTDDDLVPYEGGVVISDRVATQLAPPTLAVLEKWAALNACPAPGAAATVGLVTTTDWAGCAGRSKVRLVTIEGAGHNWYATEFGLPDGAVDATAEILQFFGLARAG